MPGEAGDESLLSLLLALWVIGLGFAIMFGRSHDYLHGSVNCARRLLRWCARLAGQLIVIFLLSAWSSINSIVDSAAERAARRLRRW